MHTQLFYNVEFAYTIEWLCLQWKCHIDTKLSIQTNENVRVSLSTKNSEVIESLAISTTQFRLFLNDNGIRTSNVQSLSRQFLYSNFNWNVFNFFIIRVDVRNLLSRRNFFSCFNQFFIIRNLTEINNGLLINH